MLITSFVPAGGTPDHLAAPPGNQQHFNAGLGSTYGPGCVTNQLYAGKHAQWSTTDSQNMNISSADDDSNGIATCIGPTNASVSATLNAYGFTESRTASITCK